MKQKLYIYIEEAPYRKGVEKYLELTGGADRNITLVESLAQIRRDEKALLLTDTEGPEVLKLDKLNIYYLTDEGSERANTVCKYNSFDNILSNLRMKENRGVETGFKVLCLSSPRSGSGKSLVAREAARLLSKTKKTALISIYPSFTEDSLPYRLDELLLSSMNDGKIELQEDGSGLYRIAPFKLIEDYIELDAKAFHKLLGDLNERSGIEYFIVEARHFLDRTSRELIKLADINLVLIEEGGEIYEEELNYLRGLTSKEARFKILVNKVKRLRNPNELPYVYGLIEGGEEVDLRHYSNLLKQILEEV